MTGTVLQKPNLRRRARAIGLGCLLPIVVTIGALYGAFKFAEHRFQINLMPADLEVTGILYSREEKRGSVLLPLPGDNETGILLYGLPDAVADKIATDGLDFFRRPENTSRRVGPQQSHSLWNETPLGMTLSDYLNQFGFEIAIDPSVEALLNDALSKPGSFYSYGRTGLMVVIPKARRAMFAYAG